jgi:hypothetical protein
MTVDLMAFEQLDRDLTLGALRCDQTLDFQLALRPWTGPADQTAAGETSDNRPAAAAQQPAAAGDRTQSPSAVAGSGQAGPRPPAQPAGRAKQPGRIGQANRFTTLNVQQDANGAEAVETTTTAEIASQATRLLPPVSRSTTFRTKRCRSTGPPAPPISIAG